MKIAIASLVFTFVCPGLAASQPAGGLEYAAPAGVNYDKAEFRFWQSAGDRRASRGGRPRAWLQW